MTESRFARGEATASSGADGPAFARGALVGVISRGAGFGMQYGFLAIVGRLLGAAPAAPFYTILGAATVLGAVGRAGLDHFGLREIAASIANRHEGIVRALSVRLLAIQVLWTAALVAMILPARHWLAATLVLGGSSAVVELSALGLGFVLTFSLAAYVLAFRGVLESALVKTIVPYGVGSAILTVLYLYSDAALRSAQAVGALLTGLAIAVVIGGSIIVRKTAGASRSTSNAMPAVVLSRSLALAAIPLLMLGMTALDVVLLQAARPGAETSFYQASQRTSMTLTLGLLAINSIAAPMISAAFATGRNEELARVIHRASRWSLLQATSIAVLLIVMGKSVLQLFGSEFQLGYRMLLVLVVAQIFNCATGPVLQLFIMTGNERTAFAVLFPVVAIAVPGYYLAGTLMGGIGVALVVTSAFAAWNAILVVLARTRFGIWLSFESWLLSGALLVGAGALALFLTSGRFSAWGFAYLAATVVGLWAFGLTAEDRQLLRRALTKAPEQTASVG